MRLWPRAVPLPMKFHELRHSTATVLLRLHTPMAVVQKILGHASIDLTVDTYGHLEVEDMRAALDRMPGPPIVVKQIPPSPLAATLLLRPASRNTKARTPAFPPMNPGLNLERNTGFEPATFALARQHVRLAR